MQHPEHSSLAREGLEHTKTSPRPSTDFSHPYIPITTEKTATMTASTIPSLTPSSIIRGRPSQKSIASNYTSSSRPSQQQQQHQQQGKRVSMAAAYLRNATSSSVSITSSSSRHRSDSNASQEGHHPSQPDSETVSVTISDLMAFLRFADGQLQEPLIVGGTAASLRAVSLRQRPSVASMANGVNRATRLRPTSPSPSTASRRSRGPSLGSSSQVLHAGTASQSSLSRSLSSKKRTGLHRTGGEMGEAQMDRQAGGDGSTRSARSRSRSRGNRGQSYLLQQGQQRQQQVGVTPSTDLMKYQDLEIAQYQPSQAELLLSKWMEVDYTDDPTHAQTRTMRGSPAASSRSNNSSLFDSNPITTAAAGPTMDLDDDIFNLLPSIADLASPFNVNLDISLTYDPNDTPTLPRKSMDSWRSSAFISKRASSVFLTMASSHSAGSARQSLERRGSMSRKAKSRSRSRGRSVKGVRGGLGEGPLRGMVATEPIGTAWQQQSQQSYYPMSSMGMMNASGIPLHPDQARPIMQQEQQYQPGVGEFWPLAPNSVGLVEGNHAPPVPEKDELSCYTYPVYYPPSSQPTITTTVPAAPRDPIPEPPTLWETLTAWLPCFPSHQTNDDTDNIDPATFIPLTYPYTPLTTWVAPVARYVGGRLWSGRTLTYEERHRRRVTPPTIPIEAFADEIERKVWEEGGDERTLQGETEGIPTIRITLTPRMIRGGVGILVEDEGERRTGVRGGVAFTRRWDDEDVEDVANGAWMEPNIVSGSPPAITSTTPPTHPPNGRTSDISTVTAIASPVSLATANGTRAAPEGEVMVVVRSASVLSARTFAGVTDREEDEERERVVEEVEYGGGGEYDYEEVVERVSGDVDGEKGGSIVEREVEWGRV
ncbi:hypothetical protein HDU67_009602 [Dinochytrium kinnereticum]|nr:hypothetical protein HDU67_009602 [Dinochytrium kinnereticum]